MKHFILASLLLLAACEGYKSPSLSSNPDKMSADTLCYRQAYAKNDPKLNSEVDARNLKCDEVLESQAPVGNPAGNP